MWVLDMLQHQSIILCQSCSNCAPAPGHTTIKGTQTNSSVRSAFTVLAVSACSVFWSIYQIPMVVSRHGFKLPRDSGQLQHHKHMKPETHFY